MDPKKRGQREEAPRAGPRRSRRARRATGDGSLLDAIDVGFVVLDRSCRIQRFTAVAARVLGLGAADRGRRFDDRKRSRSWPLIVDDVRSVAAGRTEAQRWISDEHGAAHLVRVVPQGGKGTRARIVVSLTEATEWGRGQEQLALFKFVSEQKREAEALLDEQGRFEYVNVAACRKLGRSESQLLGTPWDAVVGLPWSEVTALSDANSPQFLKIARPEPDGALRFLEVGAKRVRVGERRFQFVSLRDVTVREQTERALRLEHAVSRILSEETVLGRALERILEEFVDGLMLAVGEWWTPRDSGLQLETQRFGPSLSEPEGWISATQRPDAIRGLRERAWRQRTIVCLSEKGADGELARLEVEHGVRSGAAFPIVVDGDVVALLSFFSVNAIRSRDEIVQMLAVVRRELEEFAARTKIEESLRLRERAIRDARDGIVIVDARTQGHPILDVNAGFERLTGWLRDEVIGRDAGFLIGPGTDPEALATLREAVRHGRACRVTLLNYEKSGRPFWNDLHVTPVHDVRGDLSHLVWIQHDVTALKKAEEDLRDAQRAAESASRAKTRFLAQLSHEIRTPMSAIMGFADLLLGQLSDAEQLDELRAIQRNGSYLVDLLDDLLDLSRIEAGRLSIETSCYPLAEQLLDVESLLRPRATERGLALSIDFAGEVPDQIRTDRGRVRQVLINLIGNAIKYTDSGGVRVVVGFLQPDGVASLEFKVIDTGIGIAAHEQERIFEPFWQARRPSTGRRGGTGLGLSISRQIARQLGGDLTVDSAVGVGSTFTLRVPCGPLDDVAFLRPDLAAIVAQRAQLASSAASGPQLGCRVLVADDQPETRRLVSRLLERAGASVESAGDGRQVLERVVAAEQRGEPFDLLLLDMRMPVMSGADAVKELRGGGFRRPIVAVTASAMTEERECWLAAGCDEVFAKPVDGDALVALAARLSASSSPRPGALRVLVVEDDRDAAEALRRLLITWGARVEVAHSGAAAIEAARSLRPQLVLADLQLPDLEAEEWVPKVRQQLADVAPVCVAVSGRVAAGDVALARAAGFQLHLRKPVDPARLREVLRETQKTSAARSLG